MTAPTTTLDPVTVTVSVNATAPQELIDHLTAFARDLDHDGITVDLEIIPTCTRCGCTPDHGCIDGCAWTNDNEDLCTSCARTFPHTEHVTVTTWAYACIEGDCEHTDDNGDPDLNACPSTDLEICVDCMDIDGYTRNEENWDFTPLTTWPCDHTSADDRDNGSGILT